jgi:hypothetical protein
MNPSGKRPDARPRPRSDDADAFLPDPDHGPARTNDDLAQALGEELVRSATTGQDPDEDVLSGSVPEELGGPFIETTDLQEMAFDADPANPPGTVPEPLPRAVAGTVINPDIDDDEGEDEGVR